VLEGERGAYVRTIHPTSAGSLRGRTVRFTWSLSLPPIVV
jgi:hypothetical protein